MMQSPAELSAIEHSLGKRVFPLLLNWNAVKGTQHEGEEPLNPQSLFFAAADYDAYTTVQTRDIFLLKRDDNGFYTGIWVDPSDPYGKAIISGNYDKALQIADARLQEYPNNPDHLFHKAYALGEIGRCAEAIETYEALLSIEPNNAHAINNIAVSLEALGQVNEAHSMYQKAGKLEPNDILIQANLAQSHLSMGNVAAHSEQVERVLSMSPRNLEDRLALHNFKHYIGISNLAAPNTQMDDEALHFALH